MSEFLKIRNTKHETRNKFEMRMTKIRNSSVKRPGDLAPGFGTFGFRICFGFRYSIFGFGCGQRPRQVLCTELARVWTYLEEVQILENSATKSPSRRCPLGRGLLCNRQDCILSHVLVRPKAAPRLLRLIIVQNAKAAKDAGGRREKTA